VAVPVDGWASSIVVSVPRFFDRLSGVYDVSVVQTVVYRPPQEAILRELRQRGARRVADVGCGTGILASRIEKEMGTDLVYGCDLSTGMLGQARGRSGEVLWMLAASECLPISSASLDAVVSSHAFHFFDQAAAVDEFRRVLKPGGIVAVAVVAPRTETASRAVDLGFGGAGHFPQQGELRDLFLAAGFRTVRQKRVRRGPFRLTSPDVVTVAVAP
jgi:ubiquinone/menaquinone biosynthesis C-methylase UbiE